MKIESKIGKVPFSSEKIYYFITDFNNFKNFIPADQVQNWESSSDECSFEVKGMGKTGLKIIEKEPFKLIKISSIDSSSIKFLLWIQLKELGENDTRVKITIEPNINMMMMAMVKAPLQKFIDQLVDRMESFGF